MNYEELAKVLSKPAANYIVANHYEELEGVYTLILRQFLKDQLGELTQEVEDKLTRQLIKKFL